MTIEIICAIGMVFAIQTRYVAMVEAVFLLSRPGPCGATAAENGCGRPAATSTACSGRFAASSSPCTVDMFPLPAGATTFNITLPDEQATARFAIDIAARWSPAIS